MKDVTKEQLQEIADKSKTIADICRALDIVPRGDNYRVVKQLLLKYSIDFEWVREPWNKGVHYHQHHYVDIEDALCENSDYRNVNSLRKRIIAAGLKLNECEICHISGEEVSLELHHINGSHFDNRLENLQILCPNCHSKTDNYRGKNIDWSGEVKIRHRDPKELILSEEEIKEQQNQRKLRKRKNKDNAEYDEEGNLKPSSRVRLKPIICEYCGKEFQPHDSTTKYCSVECYRAANKGKRPSFIQLIDDFKELVSFVKVGQKYNVSDKAVVKWCAFYGMPTHAKELHEYIVHHNDADYIQPEEVKKIRVYDYDEIVKVYESGKNQKETAAIIGCGDDLVSKVLRERNIPIRNGSAKKIGMYDLEGNFIQYFYGAPNAMRWVLDNGYGGNKTTICGKRHITECCNGDCLSAYGFIWKYMN